MPIKQTTIEDVFRSINRLIGTVHSVLERFSRGYEEIDSNHLALEEMRAVLNEHFEDNSRWASALSRRIDRLEQYVILSRIGNVSATIQLESTVSKEHIHRSLKEELTVQRQLWSQYQKNVNRVNERIAKYGETTPLMNELDDFNKQLVKIEAAIERIRKALE